MKTGRETKLIPPHLPFSCISCLHVFLLKIVDLNRGIFLTSRLFRTTSASAQSTGRVSTSAENRVSLAILLAVGHFQANPKTQVTAFHDVVTYASR